MFADTSDWASAVDRTQTYHTLAGSLIRQAKEAGETIVTTNYVLAELASLLTSPLRIPRAQQIPFLSGLRAASWVEIVHIDAVLDAAAWRLWQSRPDKEWSLIDCSSFVVMRNRGLTEAFTTDHHFEQAGFIRLLK
jgi:predicted nucleic acid-binding protein